MCNTHTRESFSDRLSTVLFNQKISFRGIGYIESIIELTMKSFIYRELDHQSKCVIAIEFFTYISYIRLRYHSLIANFTSFNNKILSHIVSVNIYF